MWGTVVIDNPHAPYIIDKGMNKDRGKDEIPRMHLIGLFAPKCVCLVRVWWLVVYHPRFGFGFIQQYI